MKNEPSLRGCGDKEKVLRRCQSVRSFSSALVGCEVDALSAFVVYRPKRFHHDDFRFGEEAGACG